ncbi:MAG: branched-chain amino acid ABC transporter permease [Chloroflexota bacterium]|nr:MAG: branched-chain amino acid ABC transporter permease [Chloroflexota bacterium]
MMTFLQLLVSGFLTGGIYGLLGLAIVLVFKSTQVFNLAQGGLVMIGAYALYLFLDQLKIPLVLSLPLLVVFAVALGMGIERLALRPLIGQPLIASVMATLTLSSLLEGSVTVIWGGDPRSYPPILPAGALNLGGVHVSEVLLLAFGTVVLFLAVFAAFFKFSKRGLAMRVTAESHLVARSLGISVQTVIALVWVIAALIGAITGIYVGSIQGLTQYVPLIGLKAFAVVLVGGLESIPGAILGGIMVGVIESLATGYLVPLVGPGTGDLSPWVVLLLVLVFRPYGLFGLHRIERI